MSAVPLKIFGCLLLVAAAFSTGALLSKRLYRRRDFLNRFKTFLQALKTQLRFHGGDIFSLVNSCIGQSQLPMMFVSDEQLENAQASMFVTEAGMTMSVRDVQ